MVSAVGSTAATAIPAGGTAARHSPNLDAQLNTYRAQLEDWVTCPSAKTPEGKAKIAQITVEFDAVKKQIAQANINAPTTAPRAASAAQRNSIDLYA
jgi:hypothetical protein